MPRISLNCTLDLTVFVSPDVQVFNQCNIIIIDQLCVKGSSNIFGDLQGQQGFPVNINILRIMQVIGEEIDLGGEIDIFNHILFIRHTNITSEFTAGFFAGIYAECTCICQYLVVYDGDFCSSGVQ